MKEQKVTSESELSSNSAWHEAEQAGMDMSLVEVNLRLTPLERLRQHDRALNTALLLREAVKEQHG